MLFLVLVACIVGVSVAPGPHHEHGHTEETISFRAEGQTIAAKKDDICYVYNLNGTGELTTQELHSAELEIIKLINEKTDASANQLPPGPDAGPVVGPDLGNGPDHGPGHSHEHVHPDTHVHLSHELDKFCGPHKQDMLN